MLITAISCIFERINLLEILKTINLRSWVKQFYYQKIFGTEL